MKSYAAVVMGATVLAASWASGPAHAGTGLTQVDSVTVFYPTQAQDKPVTRGPFTLRLAENAAPAPGNNRLVVLSHGSGGAAWSYTDLARLLVQAGYIVAVPEHEGDNWHDQAKIGPASWKQRPAEISKAIDTMAKDARFGPLFDAKKVGMYGMSAGGHTALVLAGGRWSPSQLLKHCEAHLDEDFNTCAAPVTLLDGGVLDGMKKTIARGVIRNRLDDSKWYSHTDPRIVAIGAEVPFAADFDVESLRAPTARLGFVRAHQDIWLAPRWHLNPIAEACKTCEMIADLPGAGHGSLLSPPVPRLGGNVATLLADPPGFDRAEVPRVHAKVVAFFRKHLE
ncbi:alpha/beta hydrolase family protein [Ramlibacter albus]|uniref:Dienelactone hydrolase n=1 Tax=Ramlibacter albus TaxID=2079448 RepID=A0A923MDB2_9BURK|nr:dienelactone hydrolase [Ramlibacter albus]MBC5767219.1 dienelactone hydrolase [Ramlibacter albus]